MKQVEYLTKKLSNFMKSLDLPSSIITSYSDIEIPFNWGEFYYLDYTTSNILGDPLTLFYKDYKKLPNRVVKELTEAMNNNLEELLIDSAFKNRNIDLVVTHPLIITTLYL